MKRTRLSSATGALAALGVVCISVSAVVAQTATPLGGELFVAGKTPIDPPTNEARDTHAYVTITGPAALRMYRGMKVKETKNLCEPGKMIKRAGPLACSVGANGSGASCDFSIDLRQGSLADGRPC